MSDRMIQRRTFAIAALIWMASLASGRAIVIVPTFDELVAQAETIFFGEVVDQRSSWQENRDGRVIVTRVTFKIFQTLKGREAIQTQLEFLGGTIGDVTMAVEDVPQFRIGDRDILFVNTEGRPVSPIVGVVHGRFRVVRDPATGQDVVRRHDDSAIRSTDAIDPAATVAPLFGPELSVLQFEAEIARKLAELRGRVSPGR